MDNEIENMLNDRAGGKNAIPAIVRASEVKNQLTIDESKNQINYVRQIMKSVMVEGTHYGLIPGCGKKKALFQAGAEVLASTFRLRPRFTYDRIDMDNGHLEYIVTCELSHIRTLEIWGNGVGSCSTMEKKYRWRTAGPECPVCHAQAIMESKYKPGYYCNPKAGGCGKNFPANTPALKDAKPTRIENPDLADIYNTVLKIASKRALVGAVRTVLGASNLFEIQADSIDESDFGGYYEPQYTDGVTKPEQDPEPEVINVTPEPETRPDPKPVIQAKPQNSNTPTPAYKKLSTFIRGLPKPDSMSALERLEYEQGSAMVATQMTDEQVDTFIRQMQAELGIV